MRTIVKTSLVVTALMLLSACTAPGGAPTADRGPSAVDYPDATPVAATFTQVDVGLDRSFDALQDSGLEAIWTSPTTFTVLTGGGGNCYDEPSTIVAPDSASIRIEYRAITSEICTADARLYLFSIEKPEGVTAGTPVELSVTFPARGRVDELVLTTTIKDA